MKISFIGLGIMGSRMAANLLKNGVDLTVYNRTASAIDPLKDAGAKSALTIGDAVNEADIVFSMLANPDAVQSVFWGVDGAIKKMKKGAIWVDCSTVNPSFSKESEKIAEENGAFFMDIPVSGTLPHAEKAQLMFFIGGDPARIQEVTPYLKFMGKKMIHVGEVGMGSSYKMLVNMMLAQSMIIFSESILLGEKMGISKEFLLEQLPELAVSAPFTKYKVGMIEEGNYDVQFPLELMYKDLHLAALTAYEHKQPLYMVNMAKELYASAVKNGLGRKDFAAIHAFLEASEGNE